MRHLLQLVVLWFAFASSVTALETDLSSHKIEIRYSFKGAELILFGAVGHFDGDIEGDFDVVVVVRGPNTAAVVRQKARINGIWINDEQVTFPEAPGYYAVAASRPVNDIAASEILAEQGIGFDNLTLDVVADEGLKGSIPSFREALYRIREKAGLYRQEKDMVAMRGEELFRTDVRLPANVPVGSFLVDAFIFQEGQVLAKNRVELVVDKEGFERAAYTFAHAYPFLYGLTAVLIALGVGWIVGVVGKK
ncbi:membrane protein [Kordiimonas sediminis]|uniref:Membrane protein n=1 Tax=Kordiimonas sediminis TaxID=1735581 RepID=A0A919E6D6_9PROT|nr:TIGR02186 family protein [Kordiimonas sediminis]GHF16797.1 membrane protein [Kordiimonas sediminis]